LIIIVHSINVHFIIVLIQNAAASVAFNEQKRAHVTSPHKIALAASSRVH